MFFKKWRMRRRSRKLHEHLELRAHSKDERVRYADRFSVKAFVERHQLRAKIIIAYINEGTSVCGDYSVEVISYVDYERFKNVSGWEFSNELHLLATNKALEVDPSSIIKRNESYLEWLRNDNVATWLIAEIHVPIELRRHELIGEQGEIPRRMKELYTELEEAKKLETLWKTKLESDEFKDVAEAHLEIVRIEQIALEECLTALMRVQARLGKFFNACTKYIFDLSPLIEVLVLAERTRVLQERRAELEAKTQATVSNNGAFVLGKMQELQGKLQTFGEEVGVVVGADRLPFDPRERMRMLVQSERVLAEQIDSIEHEITTPSFVSA